MYLNCYFSQMFVSTNVSDFSFFIKVKPHIFFVIEEVTSNYFRCFTEFFVLARFFFFFLGIKSNIFLRWQKSYLLPRRRYSFRFRRLLETVLVELGICGPSGPEKIS